MGSTGAPTLSNTDSFDNQTEELTIALHRLVIGLCKLTFPSVALQLQIDANVLIDFEV